MKKNEYLIVWPDDFSDKYHVERTNDPRQADIIANKALNDGCLEVKVALVTYTKHE